MSLVYLSCYGCSLRDNFGMNGQNAPVLSSSKTLKQLIATLNGDKKMIKQSSKGPRVQITLKEKPF